MSKTHLPSYRYSKNLPSYNATLGRLHFKHVIKGLQTILQEKYYPEVPCLSTVHFLANILTLLHPRTEDHDSCSVEGKEGVQTPPPHLI